MIVSMRSSASEGWKHESMHHTCIKPNQCQDLVSGYLKSESVVAMRYQIDHLIICAA